MEWIKRALIWCWVRITVKWASPEEIAAEKVCEADVKKAMDRFHAKCDELKRERIR